MGAMPRGVTLVLLVGALAGLGGCRAKQPPRTAPAPPPLPPPTLVSAPLTLVVIGWPPALDPVAVAALVAETAAGRPARGPVERERGGLVTPAPPPPILPSLMVPAVDEVAAAQEVREKVALARRALRALRYERLSADARAQYDTVGQLIVQAEDALRARNFLYALKVADKAATLARRLGGEEAAAEGLAAAPNRAVARKVLVTSISCV